MNRRFRRVNQAFAKMQKGEHLDDICDEMNLTKTELIQLCKLLEKQEKQLKKKLEI